MADVIIFPLTLRPPPSGGPDRRRSAEVSPFPYSRRRQLVNRHARAMRGMSDDDGEAYLTAALEQICEELGTLGIDCQANDAIEDLATAIGRELLGPSFNLRMEGGAE